MPKAKVTKKTNLMKGGPDIPLEVGTELDTIGDAGENFTSVRAYVDESGNKIPRNGNWIAGNVVNDTYELVA